jgi:hypothetical protein
VRFHHARFTDLSTNEIVKIFNEKFKLINLYKLRHERILDHEFFENQNRIELKNDQLKNLKKTIEFYKDYEKTFYEMYTKIFINYLHITTFLFIKISSDLCFTLIKFYQKIVNLVKLYDWETTMLSLVIKHHIHMTILDIIESSNWVVDLRF